MGDTAYPHAMFNDKVSCMEEVWQAALFCAQR